MLINNSNEQKIKNNKNGKKSVINFAFNYFYFWLLVNVCSYYQKERIKPYLLYCNRYVSCGFLVYTSLLRTIVLYHQTVLDAHNTIGQTKAWYSTNS